MNPAIPSPLDDIIANIEELKGRNQYAKARQTALQALSKYTDDYRIYEELADIYIFEENLDKAEEVIGYARALHPDSGAAAIYPSRYAPVPESGCRARAYPITSSALSRFSSNI